MKPNSLLIAISLALVLVIQSCRTTFDINANKIVLAGDSTMSIKEERKRPETGWGEKLPQYFDEKLVIENHAKNGRSTKTFISEGRWNSLAATLTAGDIVLIQFGHNDSSEKKPKRYTTPSQYKRNLAFFVDEARKKDCTPILLTPIMRRRFDSDGKFYDTHGVYPDLVRALATEKSVPLIDMHKESQQLLERLGAEKSKDLFLLIEPGHQNYPDGLEDNTHFSPYGAKEIAKIVADWIRHSDIQGIAKHLLPTD